MSAERAAATAEALRQVRANLVAAASFLTQCGDATNLRSEPILIDADLVRFAEAAAQAEALVLDMIRMLPPALPDKRRAGRPRISA